MEYGILNLTFPRPEYNIKIRYWEPKDQNCVIAGSKDPYIPKTTSIPVECEEKGALDWIRSQNHKITEGTDLPLCIANDSTNEAIGMIGIFGLNVKDRNPRGGYWVAPPYRGNSVAAKALAMITPWVTDQIDLKAIELLIEPGNTVSRKSAEYAGYKAKEILPAHTQIDGQLKDMYLYSWKL